MNTIELNTILSTNKVTKKYFRGTFAYDLLPCTVEYFPSCYVINTDTSNQSGTHWTCVFFESAQKASFFCSLGKSNYTFMPFILNNSKIVTCNNVIFQNSITSVCGLYCCIFLYYKCLGIDLTHYLCECSSILNDINIYNVFKKIFNISKNQDALHY